MSAALHEWAKGNATYQQGIATFQGQGNLEAEYCSLFNGWKSLDVCSKQDMWMHSRYVCRYSNHVYVYVTTYQTTHPYHN